MSTRIRRHLQRAIMLGASMMATAAFAASAHPVSLFDGHSLKGWEPRLIATNGSNTPLEHIFAPEDGVIHVYPDAPQASAQPNAILVSRKSYGDYRLHVEYRWGTRQFAARLGSPRDAGVLLFITKDTPGLVPTWYNWPKSLECQIMEGDSGSAYLLKARASGFVDPTNHGYRAAADGGAPATVRLIGHDLTSYKLTRSHDAAEQADWNSIDVEVHGNSAHFYLNSMLVNEVNDIVEDRAGPPVAMTHGHIALQAEGAEVFYRNVTIAPLDAKR